MSTQSVHPKPLQNKNAPSNPPQSVTDVDEAMKAMDKTHGTSFYSWIKSPDNIGYLCTFKKTLFEQHYKEDPQRVANAICWISEEWTIGATAELILKLFYHWRLDSPDFADIIKLITKTWSREKQTELVDIILIGESPYTCASFIRRYLSTAESNEAARSFISDVFMTLRWNEKFLKDFLLEYAKLAFTDSERRMVTAEIQKTMEKWRSAKKYRKTYANLLSPSSPDSTTMRRENQAEFITFGVAAISLLFEAGCRNVDNVASDSYAGKGVCSDSEDDSDTGLSALRSSSGKYRPARRSEEGEHSNV